MNVDAVLALLGRGDGDGALALLDDAVSTDETGSGSLVARGMVQLANDHPAEALAALRLAVSLGDTAPTTLLNLALAEQKTGDLTHALDRMEKLERSMPDWDEPPLRRAEALRAADRLDEAEVAYNRVLEINPHRESALLGLSGLLLLRGAAAAARVLLLRCCGLAPGRAEAWDLLGLALLADKDRSLAESAFAEALRLAPDNLQYALHRVDAAFVNGSQEALLAWFEVAREADPLNYALPSGLGVLLERLGRLPEAIDAYETATTLAPDVPHSAILFANALARANRLQEADTALRRAAELDPKNRLMRSARGATLYRAQRHAEARAELLTLVERGDERVHDLCNLANVTTCVGLQEEAVSLARRAVALDPEGRVPRCILCGTLPYCDGVTGAELLAALKDCSDRLPRGVLAPLANTPEPDRPLIVGLLSGSFRPHPVGWLTVAGFETLNPNAFRIVCLAQNSSQDWMARRFRAVAREWHDIDQLDDKSLALRARELGIDILIDLGGYGDLARMPACAYRLAPVQVKWVGMQYHSSGLAEMDWIITDRWETPPELEHVYSERPLRMPDGYVCYSPPPYAPDVAPLPALFRGHITFGCFNNLAKVTPRVIATWCEILQRLPDARLVLKTQQFSDPPTAERVLAKFAKLGIHAERIELRGGSGHRAFMGEYNDIDIVLDPFPYSGGLTTCEALWMGVPTVTMPGEIFASRHSMSHLSNAGLTDWVAPDLPTYVELAVAKASDIEELATLRSRLRAKVKASPLCDAPRFGGNLGKVLRHAWSDWCAKKMTNA
jgi:predicted O-linked N-acetylglucosamine transferase (SPINDLY family)